MLSRFSKYIFGCGGEVIFVTMRNWIKFDITDLFNTMQNCDFNYESHYKTWKITTSCMRGWDQPYEGKDYIEPYNHNDTLEGFFFFLYICVVVRGGVHL